MDFFQIPSRRHGEDKGFEELDLTPLLRGAWATSLACRLTSH